MVRGEVQAGRAGGGGRSRCTHSVQKGLNCRFGAGHGEEHTRNIHCMFVTLEVSKLSGWLNAFAFCRESKGGHAVWGEGQRPGRQEAAGARGASSVRERARLQIGGRARGE